MTVKSKIGFYAEQVAAQYLSAKGYTIIDRNWRRPWGELDIVASKGSTMVFAEVKANSMATSSFNPEGRVDWRKMAKTVRTARTWLAYQKCDPDQEWQVDVISVSLDKIKRTAQIKHFKNVEI